MSCLSVTIRSFWGQAAAFLGILIWAAGRALGAEAEPEPTLPQPPRLHEVVRFGNDGAVAAEDSVSKVVVVSGDATVDGEVREGVVVVGGNLKVTGKIRGTVVVVFGDIEASSSAVLRRPAFVIGGKIQQQTGAKLRSDNIVINQDNFPLLTGFLKWVTQGAVYLRPLPPRVLWAWSVPAAFLLLYALMGLILAGPTDRCVQVLANRPMACYLAGLLGCVLFSLCFLFFLILGTIGIGLILAFALLMLVLFGRMVVVRFIGFQLGQQLGLAFLQRPLVSLILGSVVLCLMYMIPVIGLGVWIGVFPLAVGGLILAGFQAVRPARPPEGEAMLATEHGAGQGGRSGEAPIPPMPPPYTVGRPVGFFVRTVATLLDFIVVICLAHLVGAEGRGFLLLWLGYHVALWSWSGATLGARVFGLALVETDGRAVGFQVALVRALASFLSAIPLFLGFLWVAWDVRKQSWHDKLAGTTLIWRRG
ncbi:MAG: RDD family protein [Verrucomicrobiales bacterium]|nr:RDD family protein [Verrucomicrobiales bacterium]